MQLQNRALKPELYRIKEPGKIFSPGLVIFRELLERNLAEMIRIAGGPDRLRPHCKTHKTREMIQLQLEAGIAHHKCATIAEAEMLAEAGAEDILLAYQMVGPNVERFVQLVDKYPDKKFTCLVDSPIAVQQLSGALCAISETATAAALIDLDPGMNRTGIQPGPRAIELFEMVLASENIEAGGLHWYDGHHRQSDRTDRMVAVESNWQQVVKFRDQLLLNGIPVQRIVAGGTGSFPILAELGEPNLELSPGTTVFHDALMTDLYPEMDLEPCLGILTRVISHNRPGFLTLDVGHKACAADQPAGERLAFPDIPDAVEVQHSEEHLVIQTAQASEFRLGEPLIAIPRHVCPTTALFDFVDVVEHGMLVDRWSIEARKRQLNV